MENDCLSFRAYFLAIFWSDFSLLTLLPAFMLDLSGTQDFVFNRYSINLFYVAAERSIMEFRKPEISTASQVQSLEQEGILFSAFIFGTSSTSKLLLVFVKLPDV